MHKYFGSPGSGVFFRMRSVCGDPLQAGKGLAESARANRSSAFKEMLVADLLQGSYDRLVGTEARAFHNFSLFKASRKHSFMEGRLSEFGTEKRRPTQSTKSDAGRRNAKRVYRGFDLRLTFCRFSLTALCAVEG
jgi:hypothetical protein